MSINFRQISRGKLTIITSLIASLFFILGIVAWVEGSGEITVSIVTAESTAAVITNGSPGTASIAINCRTEDSREVCGGGFCDGDWVGGVEEDCEGDWVTEQGNCCVAEPGELGWVPETCEPENAIITSCTVSDDGGHPWSCTGELGGPVSERICTHTFDAGINESYTVTASAEDSFGNAASSTPYALLVDTRAFIVDSIQFTDSAGGIVDPRSSSLIITTSLPIGSISLAGNITFEPLDAAETSGCSIGLTSITCQLKKQGELYGQDIYIKPEYSQVTVIIPDGLVLSSSDTQEKSLIGNRFDFDIGCVLRKVTLDAKKEFPQDDVRVEPEDEWQDCDPRVGQERRTIYLRHLSCDLAEVVEVRGCQEAPIITKPINRRDYSDLFATINPPNLARDLADIPPAELEHATLISFGPLKSILKVYGDYFYNFSETAVTERPDLDKRTFTEVWMGEILWDEVLTGVKTAGEGEFSQSPFLPKPNDQEIAFITEPVCTVDKIRDCFLEVQIRQEVPECTKEVEVRAVVQPKIYQVDELDPLKWDDGNQVGELTKRQEQLGKETFVVVPSTDLGGGRFRGARYYFDWADKQSNNKFIQYLNSSGAGYNQAPVGLPLSFTLEYDYEEGVTPRYCLLPDDDHKICSVAEAQSGQCFCGFGRKNYLDDPTSDFLKIKFYNGTPESEAATEQTQSSVIRPEQEVSLYEVGKPWNKFKIFPLVPFLDEKVKPGVVRTYVCGLNIGFIESAAGGSLQSLDAPEEFKLLFEPFEVSRLSPFWGHQTVAYPLIWGYDLQPPTAELINATLGTWPGSSQIVLKPQGKSRAEIVLPADQLQPRGTSLADLELCRADYCAKTHQEIIKEKYQPLELPAPRIETVSGLEHWQATSYPIFEDIPATENFCQGETVTLKGTGFGEEIGQVYFWQGNNWADPASVAIRSWLPEEIVVVIDGESIGQSADCASTSHTLVEVSNLRLPARVCQVAKECLVLDQAETTVVPPPRVRLVEEGEWENYCLDDRIKISGEAAAPDSPNFGEERLGARVKIGGVEVARYISWSDEEVIVTPPAVYSGKRSPFCPRTDERNKDGLLVEAKKSDLVSITCPDLPAGSRACQIEEVQLVDPYLFYEVPIYRRAADYDDYDNICLEDQVEISGSGFGTVPGRVDFWSLEDGWLAVDQYLKWSDELVKVLPPPVSAGQGSPDCPRARPGGEAAPGEVSILKGPLRLCPSGQACQFLGLNSTNVDAKIRIYKKILTNKQYLVDEEVTITGRFFSDIRSQDEFEQSSADVADRRNSAYLEFYSQEIGWVPAGEYLHWDDQNIVAKAPKISLEDKYGGPSAGVSVAAQPIRVCTGQGCSTNLVNYQSPEIVEARVQDDCVVLKGFNFGEPKELGAGYGAYKTGDWWKEANFPIWSDNEVTVCFNGETAGILRFCRADDKCLYWDLVGQQEIAWHYPEVFAVSPLCLPAARAVEQLAADQGIEPAEVKVLLTLYGEDLDRGVIESAGNYIKLANGAILSGIEIYDDSDEEEPKQGFKQQYQDKIVLRIPALQVEIPEPIDEKEREVQAITGRLFLKTAFAHKNQLEVSNTLTFSNYCNLETQCVANPVITQTNLASYVGENKDKVASLADDGSAIISGCNLGSGEGSYIIFGDILQHQDLAAIADWSTNGIRISTPLGAKSGFLGVNVWTGLMEYSAVWLTEEALNDLEIQPRTNLLFNILPTMETLGVKLGVAGQIAEVYGSDFCGPLGCTDFLKDVYLGVWQGPSSSELDLFGAPAQIFDVNPRRLRIKIPAEDYQTYGEVQANLDKMAYSGQILVKRGDDATAEPILKTTDFKPAEFKDNNLYFTKTPILKEVIPGEIAEDTIPLFKGADFYGLGTITDKLSYQEDLFDLKDEVAKQYPVEFVQSEPYNLRDVTVVERAWRYPNLLDLKSTSYQRLPAYLFAWGEPDRVRYFTNPQGVILSNWDGSFSAWLVGANLNPAVRPVYTVLAAEEVQCLVREPLSLPSPSAFPPPLPPGVAFGIHKIVPLPLLDVCYFCQDQTISIFAEDGTSFGELAGQVYFWSNAGWLPAALDFWTKTEVAVKLTAGQAVKHNRCNGSLSQGRLPLKLCRAVEPEDPEECIVWSGPKTHIKLQFAAGGLPQNSRQTLGRFNRLNVESSLVLAGDNLVEGILFEPNYNPEYGLVEVFINKLYNDIQADVITDALFTNIFKPLAESRLGDAGLLWLEETYDYRQKKYEYSANTYNSSKRYRLCLDEECSETYLLYPELQPAVGDLFHGQEIKLVDWFAYGLVSDAQVYLIPPPPAVKEKGISYSNDGYLSIIGENFYHSRIVLNGGEFSAVAPAYSQLSSTEIRLFLSKEELMSGIYKLQIINYDCGRFCPRYSREYSFRCDAYSCSN